MGFSVHYCSTRAVTAAEAEAIDQAAARRCDGPVWGDGCEEIGFHECLDGYTEGHLSGSSKLSRKAHTRTAIPSAETPVVTIRDLIDALCQISRDHWVDWEIGHDHHDGPVGCIRSGLADAHLAAEIDRLSAEFEAIRRGEQLPT